MTFPDATCKRYKPQNRKATQNKPIQNANATVVLLSMRKNFEQLFFPHHQLKIAS
jgi:hypothetical protein